MRHFFAVTMCLLLLAGSGLADDAQVLKSDKDKESYALGYQFGEGIKMQELDLDLDLLFKGVKDAFSGSERLLSQEETKRIISDLRKKVTAARQKQLQEQTAKNLAEGQAFLEENKKKEGVITLPSGLQYKVIAEGAGPSPKADDSVTVNYKGTFINGTEFDSSYARNKPETVQVNGVIKGWTEALQLMKAGAKWQLFIPANLAYGESGMPPRIGPNSTLIFEVELLSINKEDKPAGSETPPPASVK